jgi:hypothetical protein
MPEPMSVGSMTAALCEMFRPELEAHRRKAAKS